MDLPTPLIAEALTDAEAEADPESLAAAQRMRKRHRPEVAAAALDQVALRRRGTSKFGDQAATMFFTRDGLEQATRPNVAAHHARRIRASGASRVVDLGCGIGADAMAFAEAGLQVIAIEIDEHTAEIARANLADAAEVITGDAEQLAAELIMEGDAIFLDPARRTNTGRLWRTEDFRPSWSLVTELLTGGHPVGVKLGPALPHREIPDGVEAEWVTDRGETVEVCLWSGPGSAPDQRAAFIMPDHRIIAAPTPTPAPAPVRVGAVGRFLYEPDGAVIRAGAIGTIAEDPGAWLLDDQIAYLSSDELIMTPYATVFEIIDELPYSEKFLRRWVRDHEIGTLEIKKRGVDIDPALLRKRLKPRGDGRATLVIARTPTGARVLVCQRIVGDR